MRKFSIYIILLLLTIGHIYPQKYANNWVFGKNAGLSFSSAHSNPTEISGSSMISNEGCSSISDTAGNLMFYTDGTTVWNRNNLVMTNGNHLSGSHDASQSALIIPKPGSDDHYYIFTVDNMAGPDGFRYSIVDISKQGGLGEVISKNNHLHNSVSEKVTAVHHSNYEDVWVITHEWSSNVYLSYKVTSDGIETSPVRSQVGGSQSTGNSYQGYLKASPTGTKIAAAVTAMDRIEVLKFNNSTGVLSDPINIPIGDSNIGPYGLEFSPDGTRLYAALWSEPGIIQFDLMAGNLDAIIASATTVTDNDIIYSALQLAPDGRLYAVNQNCSDLSVIEYPDELGTNCSFKADHVSLGEGRGRSGLPNYNQSYFDAFIYYNDPLCSGEELLLKATTIPGAEYEWTGPNGFHSYEQNPVIPISNQFVSGVYTLSISNLITGYEKTIEKTVHIRKAPAISINGSAFLCEGESLLLETSGSETGDKYHWSTGDTTASIYATEPGEYIVTVENKFGCISSVSKTITQVSPPELEIDPGGPTVVCEGQEINLLVKSDSTGLTYLWSTGETSNAISVNKSGIYTVTVESEYGCTASDTIEIHVKPSPVAEIEVIGPTTVCAGETIVLKAALDDPWYNYKWSTGDSSSIIRVDKSGEYSLEVSLGDCIDVATIDIIIHQKTNVSIDTDGPLVFCENVSRKLTAVTDGEISELFWSTGDINREITVRESGYYTVWVRNPNGCIDSSSVYIKTVPMPNAHIETDGPLSFCEGSELTLTASPIGSDYKYLWSTGDTTSQITVNESGHYTVSVSVSNDCMDETSIDVEVYPAAEASISVSGPTSFCEGDSVVLTVGDFNDNFNYTWSNGKTDQQIVVRESGIYTLIADNNFGCSDTSSIVVKSLPSPVASIITDMGTSICSGDMAVLTALPNNPDYSFKWSTGEDTPEIIVEESGIYSVIISVSDRCKDSAFVEIIVNPSPEVHIVADGQLSFCQGESVNLSVENYYDNNTYIWSTGENDRNITVNESGIYSLIVINEYGCTDSAEIEVEVYPMPEVGILSDGTSMLCEGESVILTASTDDEGITYLWSTGENSREIEIIKPGVYSLTVTNENGCSSTTEIEISQFQKPEVNIQGDDKICLGEATILVASGDFSHYLWSNGKETREIEVTLPGTYKVVVTDENGCTAEESFVVEEWQTDIGFDDPAKLVFGRTSIGGTKRAVYVLYNLGVNIIEINSFDFKGQYSAFNVVSPSLPANILPGDGIELTIQFSPKSYGYYKDSLIVNTVSPCKTRHAVPLSGLTRIRSQVWLPDTSAETGRTNFSIPLYAKLDYEADSLVTLSYTAEIQFDAEMYMPIMLTNGVIKSSKIINKVRILEIEDNNIILNKKETVLTEIRGDVLLSDNEYTPLIISKFDWSGDEVETDTTNGSLCTAGSCVPFSRSLEFYFPTKLSIEPNPAVNETNISLRSQDKGTFIIDVYNMNGIRIDSQTLVSTGCGNDVRDYNIVLNLSKYSSGIFQIVLRTPVNVLSKELIILK